MISCRSRLALLFACSTVVACASERAPINKVQPNALDKSFFVGKDLASASDDPVFYWRNFVVDGSEAQSLIGIGSWSTVDRIRWEITETMLLAHKAYQLSGGGDNKGAPGGPPDGAVVAAYPISSHFDIKRAYNPSTGESLNVIEENTTDRPWNERQYFRVDWSQNLVNTPDWYDMFAGKLVGNIVVTPVTYAVTDPTSDDAPHFETENGYFDVTDRFYVQPQPDSAGLPYCFDVGSMTGTNVNNCDPQEATVRSSYWRVDQLDPDDDFEPFENTRAPLDIVGNPGGVGDSSSVGVVTAPQVGYDPQYGYTDASFRRFMNIHNIWKQSHQTWGSCKSDGDCSKMAGSTCLPSGACTVPCNYDARGDNDGNGTDDQCENSITGYTGAQGAQCSVKNRCTIPYRDRDVEPVGYWVNKEMPAELTDTTDAQGNFVSLGPTEDVIHTWNQALELSVAKAREVECRRTNTGDRKTCHGQFFDAGTDMVSYGGWGIEKVKADAPHTGNVVVPCHNPVRSYDDPVCGTAGTGARVGDVRKHFIFYWPYASEAPWGGIADWNGDPLTGQIVGGSATIMGRSTTLSAAQTRDIIMVANGEMSFADFTNGTPAYLYEKTLRDGHAPEVLSQDEIARRIAAIDAGNAAQQIGPRVSGTFNWKNYLDFVTPTAAPPSSTSPADVEFAALTGALRGTEWEAAIVDPDWAVTSLGVPPGGQLTNDVLDVISPLRGMAYPSNRMTLDGIINAAELRGICLSPEVGSVGNPDVQGVAHFFALRYSDAVLKKTPGYEKYTPAQLSKARADSIYRDLWIEAYKGIALHEMGHSLGLFHNFGSSYDAVNYDPQYWQLRTHEGQSSASCNGAPRTGTTSDLLDATKDACMGPRYLDPETDDEMGRRPDASGGESRPGIAYFAHTSTMEYQIGRFFESIGLGQYDLFAMNVLYGRVLQTMDPTAADGVDPAAQSDFEPLDYTQLVDFDLVNWANPNLTDKSKQVQSMHYTEVARRMKLFDPSRCRPATADEKDHAEWRIVHGKVCSPPPKDYAAWDDVVDGNAAGALPTKKVRVSSDRPYAAGSARWPYRWGQTSGYTQVNPFDSGGDIYEVTQSTIQKFDYSYPIDHFRRGSRDATYLSAPSNSVSNFFERLRSYHWGIANSNAYYRAFGDPNFQNAANSDDWWRPYVMAETDMFNAIARALVMPEIGGYSADPLDLPQVTPVDTTPGRRLYLDGIGNPDFTVDASTGRFISWSVDSGPTGGGSWDYWNWIGHVGYSYEKGVAAMALTDGRPNFYTISAANYLDGRAISVNFRSDMPQAVDRLLGGLITGDWETIAPYVVRSEYALSSDVPAVHLLDLTNTQSPPSRPSDAQLLYPNLGYRQQISALLWAHVYSRLNTDLTLANKLRIWVDGYPGGFTIPASEQAKFYNPESGLTYVARKWGSEIIDGKSVDKGIGSRMLAHANALLAYVYQVQKDSSGNPVLDQYGMPALLTDSNGNAMLVTDAANDPYGNAGRRLTEYRLYVGNLDAAVQIGNIVGYGPFNATPAGGSSGP